MQETIEFRIPEKFASKYLPIGVGIVLGGTVRKLEIPNNDLLLTKIGIIDGEFRKKNRVLFTYFSYRRSYSSCEIESAELLHCVIKKVFEPAGEECGTLYDDSQSCPTCGAGAPQTSPLFLDGRRIPKKVDFAQTIAGEIVVSSNVVALFNREKLTGASFNPVCLSNRKGVPSKDFFQLQVKSPLIELDASTRVGNDPFDMESYGRCPHGDLAGLNLLSEVRVRKESMIENDLLRTTQMIGVRRGLLRPRPILLISPRAWKALSKDALKGLGVEVAYIV